MADKSRAQHDIEGFTDEQFSELGRLVDAERSRRGGGETELRHRVSTMTDQEFEQYKRSLGR